MTAVTPTPPSPVKSSLPAIFFTDELKREYPSIFMYAIAGAGKTNALRSLVWKPEEKNGRRHWNPLVLATEIGNTKGMGTLSDLHIAAILLNDLDQLQAVTTELAAKAKPGELYYGSLGPFYALGLDSLTGVGTFLERASKKLRGWDMIWDKVKGSGADPRTAYPYIAEKGRQVVEKLMALPVPLIMTCREQTVTEGEGDAKKEYAAPELPGQKLPKELPGWPEATLRLRMVNGQRLFATQNEGDVISRIRLGAGMRLPNYVNPDLDAVIRVLQGDASAIEDLTPRTQSTKKTPQQLAAEQRSAGVAQAPTIQMPAKS